VEFTHMGVAVAVASGAADAGLGVLSAAKALELDFLPVTTESYDLVIAARHFDSEPIRRLLETIRSEEFARRVAALGGYDTSRTGTVLA
jgi:putative molybdopterin biosynthesis protein